MYQGLLSWETAETKGSVPDRGNPSASHYSCRNLNVAGGLWGRKKIIVDLYIPQSSPFGRCG